MGKKKSDNDEDDENTASWTEKAEERPVDYQALPAPPRRRGLLPALSIGDVLALITLIVLSAALLLEGYHKDFKDYSKEIVALFAVVVGFLLGRKT